MSEQIIAQPKLRRNRQNLKAVPTDVDRLYTTDGDLRYYWDAESALHGWRSCANTGEPGEYDLRVPFSEVYNAYTRGTVTPYPPECTCRPDGGTTCPVCKRLAKKIYGEN